MKPSSNPYFATSALANAFVSAAGLSAENDIAVLFLEDAVSNVDVAQIVASDGIAFGSQVLLAGYGTTCVDGPVLGDGTTARRRCVNSFVNAIDASEFQAGAGTETGRRCRGDSGGPTFLRAEPRSLIGLGSRAIDVATGCAAGGVDTRLSAHVDYLDDVLRGGCVDGGPRVECSFPGLFSDVVDGGALDAGALDAGVVDTGIDAGALASGDRRMDVEAAAKGLMFPS